MQSDAYINLICHKSVLHVDFFYSNGTVLLFCTESLKLRCTQKSLKSDISQAAWIVLGERFIFGYLQSHFLQETILNRNIAITYMQTQSEITFSVLTILKLPKGKTRTSKGIKAQASYKQPPFFWDKYFRI